MQNANHVDFLTFVYAASVAGISYWLMDEHPSDALAWLKAENGFELEGWTSKDYLLLVLFVTMSLVALAEALLYDKSNLKAPSELKNQEAPGGVVLIGVAAFAAGFSSAASRIMNHIIKFLVKKAVMRAGLISLLLCLCTKQNRLVLLPEASGSDYHAPL